MIYTIPPINHEGLEDQAWIQDFLEKEDLEKLASMCKGALNNATVTTEEGATEVKSEIRATSIKWLDYSRDTENIYKVITNAMVGMNEKFFKFDITGIYEPLQLGFYSSKIKAFYNLHKDSSLRMKGTPRKLSMCLLLNDPSEFEGGDLVIQTNHKEFVLEQKQGRAWIFPSWALHKVTPVTKGVRKSLVVWGGGPQFR